MEALPSPLPEALRYASVKPIPKPMGIPGRWKPILDSDFRYGIDTTIWRAGWFDNGISGPVNQNENACYSPQNISLPSDGTVHLDLTSSPSRCQHVRRAFTGAILTTNPADGRSSGGFTYRYGVMQARVYIPGIHGEIANWPTVMGLGQVWPKDGEDDVLEGLKGVVCMHFHSRSNVAEGFGFCDPRIKPGWHTIASNWEPGSVTWYYDGVEVDRTTRGVTSAPMYLVLLNSVSLKAPRVSRPSSLRVAYVRVWQHPGPRKKRK